MRHFPIVRRTLASISVRASVSPISIATQGIFFVAGLILAIASLAGIDSRAQSYNGGRNARALVVQPINEGKLVTLEGNTPGAAIAEYDRGAVSDSLPMEHMQLQLQRPPELEGELENLIGEQQRKGSPEYHHWLTAKEFGDRFGVSPDDIERVSSWLQNHGFRVDGVPTSGMVIEFSGTAGQVKAAFHTEIHNLNVDGEEHIGNMSDPQIPAAFTGVVKGVHALHNFMPHSMLKKRPDFTFVCPAGTTIDGSVACSVDTTFYAFVPEDLATIYNLNPAFAKGITGTGQTVVVIEDTLLQNVSDIATFRSAFGLSGYSGTFSQVTATGTTTCNNSGVNGDEGEAALDAEWAGASAPNAAIKLASCADTQTVFGGLIALQNLINGTSPPAIVSISYGECESGNGAAANASYSSTYQQAATEGVSVFVSSGDEGAASCDANKTVATHGITVSGFASTPYNVAVGGTDFGDLYANLKESGPALSTYWAGTSDAAFGSALSYIPEVPWNDSCASQLIYTLNGYTQSYGSTGFCNTAVGKAEYRTTGAGSGGPSAYEGISTLFPTGNKPAWQSVLGNPSDSTRDIPDVSLFAANGVFNHFLEYCLTDASQGGAPCTYTNPSDALALAAGGTSFASPIMAGIQALINQSQGGAQGNPNPRLYALGNTEYGTSGNAACNSSLGTGVGSSCVFYDVTQGDIDVNCSAPRTGGALNCFGTSGTGNVAVDGELSTSNSTNSPAYGTTAGWDFATGLGSVNVYNLIQDWDGVPTTTAVTASIGSQSALGESVTFTATITPALGNTETGSVTWSSNTGCTVSTVSAGVATCTTTSLPLGANTVTATYGGDSDYTGSNGSTTETVNPDPTISSSASATFTVGSTGSFTVSTTGTPKPALSETDSLPAGVSFTDNGNGTATISGTPSTGDGGVYALTITASTGSISVPQSFTLTVNEAPSITSGSSFTFSVGGVGAYIVTATGYPAPTFSETGTLPGGITLSNIGNGRAELSGRPNAGTGGSYPLTLTATNGTAPDATQNVALTIKQNVAFTSSASTTFAVGTAGAFSVTTTGYPAPSLSATGALPSGVSFVDNGNGTASLAGTPAAGTGGTYAITINATNGFSTPSQSFTLTVDQAPVITSANSTAFTALVGGTFSVTSTGYPTAALSETGALPSGITFTDNGNGTGTLAGTTSAPGTYPITITAASSGSANATQSFTLTVNLPQFQLTTTANPVAGGTIAPASGSVFIQGTVVPLTANAAVGYTFVGWTSAADPVANATSANTTITVNGPESVTVQFAPTLVVNTPNDDSGTATNCTAQPAPGANSVDSSCSLRDALLNAASSGAGNVSFDSTSFAAAQTITLGNGTLTVPANTTVTGATSGSGFSLTSLVTVDGSAASSVFTVNSGTTASLSSLIITNGKAMTGGGIYNAGALTVVGSTISGNSSNGGGGIANMGGTLTVTGSTLSGNSVQGIFGGGEGGGIYNSGTLTVSNSTLTGNSAIGRASGVGGGIANNGGTMTVGSTTLSGNSSDGAGGGVYISGGSAILGYDIVSGNSSPTGADVSGSFTNDGGNVIGASGINLAPLGSYGGPTQTMLPLPGSSAICGAQLGVGTLIPNLAVDQRGGSLNLLCNAGTIDAGAVQISYALSFTTEPPSSATALQAFSPAPVVSLTESGVPAAVASTSVAITDSASLLGGTDSASLSAGSATFSNLVISSATSNDVLTATLALTSTLNLTAQSSAVQVTAPLGVSLSATSLSFGSKQVGVASSSQIVTLTNQGITPVAITSIQVTGPNASSFIFANNCGTSVAAGASCSIHGHFTPAVAGTLLAAVTITDSDPTSPQSITLIGTGVSPATVSLSSTSMSFGALKVGATSPTQSVTLTNTGGTALTITSISVTGANASSFIFANSCGHSLAAGASCSIHGHFTPASAGALSAAVTITDNISGSPQSITLTGTGLSLPAVSLSSTSLTFAARLVGTTSASQDVTLTNTGGITLVMSGVSVTGTDAASFIFSSTCGTGVAPGASCTIHGHFTPTATGSLSASVTITDNAVLTHLQTVITTLDGDQPLKE